MLTANDLLAPKGRVEGKSFFPDLSSVDLSSRLTEYLDQGYAKATTDLITVGSVDTAVSHYVYFRVYDAVYMSMMANPLSSSTPEAGAASFQLAQAEVFKRLADEQQALYATFVPVTTLGTIIPIMDNAVPNQFVY